MLILLAALFCLLSTSGSAPLALRWVDMTHVFDETTHQFPIYKKNFEMDVIANGSDHAGLEGVWIQFEDYKSSTHAGTHMDAPANFAAGGATVDQIPVSRFVAPASVVDITAKAEHDSDAEVTVADLLQWESTTSQSLNGTILLLRSGWGRKWNNQTAYSGFRDGDPYELHNPSLSAEAAQWLADNRNVNGVGIDTYSIDRGNTGDLAVHKIIMGSGMFALENVANMDELPIYGATLYVLPMKIGKASGAPVRIVASYPEIIFERELPSEQPDIL